MSAYKKLLAKKDIRSKLEWAVIYYGEDPVDEGEVIDAEQAAAELARLQAIEAAAREYLNQTPVGEIELARDAFGHTNTRAILESRERLAAALDGAK